MKEILDKLIKEEKFINVTNQYFEKWQYSAIARNNLELYFSKMKEIHPSLALVGIAPGYNGCRLTGIPFTSEYIVKDEIPDNKLFGINNGYLRRENIKPQKEPTATIVWEFLKENQKYPLLWNAFPFHPYKPGNKDSNRNPNKDELKFGLDILRMVMEEFHINKIFAVGKISYKTLVSCDFNGAYPKNCVNDHKMVEIPRERKWSWHERRKRKKRILSTNYLIISTSEG